MADVKALFPIGKTQWSKWNDPAREAFNSMRAKGFGFDVAVGEANAVEAEYRQPKSKKGIFDIIGDAVEDVAGVAEAVTSVAATVTPVVAIAATVAKRPRIKKGR